MARFEVTISEMYNAATKIHQAAEDYLTTACKVYALAEVLGGSWEGDHGAQPLPHRVETQAGKHAQRSDEPARVPPP